MNENDIPTSGRAAICFALLALLLFCTFGLYGWTDGWSAGQMDCTNLNKWSSK